MDFNTSHCFPFTLMKINLQTHESSLSITANILSPFSLLFLCSGFVRGPHVWCTQGHTDIKDFKVGCQKSSESISYGVEKLHPKGRQWADKCLTVWKKGVRIWLFLALKGFLFGSKLYNLSCWNSLNVPTGISKQSLLANALSTHDDNTPLRKRKADKTVRVMDYLLQASQASLNFLQVEYRTMEN